MKGLIWVLLVVVIVTVALNLPMRWQGNRADAQAPLSFLQSWQIVDLTQPLTPTMPIWSGDPKLEIEPWASYEKDSYFINKITIGEHSGTHWGTPNTFISGARGADQFSVEELVAPTVVIDLREQAARNPDYRLSVADIQAWETTYGQISQRSIVVLFTGWQDRWNDSTSFFNADTQGNYHFPGFGAEAANFLVEERKIAGLGTDTHGADPGNDEDYGASTAIYQANGLILECLAGLDQLPPIGAILMIGGLPIQGGSGSPAKVLALVPKR